MRKNLQDQLIEEYQEIFNEQRKTLDSNFKSNESQNFIHPSIPFIGKNYDKNKVLLYASAENRVNKNVQWDDDDNAVDRYRIWFDKEKETDFFPDTYIAPLTNGALLIVVAYLMKLLNIKFEYKNDPKLLLEGIAYANFGKFSLKGKVNKDYASKPSLLRASIEYVKADLQYLKPNYLILPKSIYKKKFIKNMIDECIPDCKIIPIFQLQPSNINFKNRISCYPRKSPGEIANLDKWHQQLGKGLKGKTRDNFYSVYSYLENVLRQI